MNISERVIIDHRSIDVFELDGYVVDRITHESYLMMDVVIYNPIRDRVGRNIFNTIDIMLYNEFR